MPAEHCLFLPEWVGGRYSVWSSISLPLACAIGMRAFGEMLDGARAMDEHFATAPMNANLPVLMGLIDFWNASGMGLETLAVLPYSHLLRSLPNLVVAPHIASVSPTAVKALREGAAARALAAARGQLPPNIVNGVGTARVLA